MNRRFSRSVGYSTASAAASAAHFSIAVTCALALSAGLSACGAESSVAGDDTGRDSSRSDTGLTGECALCIPEAEICVAGRCEPASCSGRSCPIGFDCREGFCRAETGCQSDDDCPSGRCVEFDCYTFECEGDETRRCSTECGVGEEACLAGVFGECDAPRPAAEFCGDNIDQDCDDVADEGCDDCDPATATDEVCGDGLDNDCDDVVDEGDCPDCADGEREPCASACGEGFRACEDGEFGLCSAVLPADEVCDGDDNDCDGVTDESLSRPCETACGAGIELCGAGAWGECDAPTVCDCDDGASDVQDCGLCGERRRTCAGSSWTDWSGCEDEGECEPGTLETDTCGESTDGICRLGTTQRTCGTTCTFSSWAECAGDVGPIAEVCGDGIDQDCDGRDLVRDDAYEPNNNCATAHYIGSEPMGEVLRGYMSDESDSNDYFSFTAIDEFNLTSSERIVVRLSEIPDRADYDLFLYRNLDDCIAGAEAGASENFGDAAEEIEWVEPRGEDGGTWYVRVSRFSGSSCEDTYRLEVTGLHVIE